MLLGLGGCGLLLDVERPNAKQLDGGTEQDRRPMDISAAVDRPADFGNIDDGAESDGSTIDVWRDDASRDGGGSDTGLAEVGSDGSTGDFVPSNVGETAQMLATGMERPAVVGSTGAPVWIVYTDSGQIDGYGPTGDRVGTIRVAGPGTLSGITYVSVPQGSSHPPLGVFIVQSLTVPMSTQLIGTASVGCDTDDRGAYPDGTLVPIAATPAMVWIALESVRIEGRVSVSANALLPGPGGFCGGFIASGMGGDRPGRPGRGPGGGMGGQSGDAFCGSRDQSDGGGGGGSFGARGGNGGAGGCSTMTIGAAGSLAGDAALSPLFGGSGGGTGAENEAGRGGHGGGALQITAMESLDVTGTGEVVAGGGGAEGGHDETENDNGSGGSGGGSGGAILLEAGELFLAGWIGAHGGSGSQGGTDTGDDGLSGAVAVPRVVPAPGPPGTSFGGGGGSGSDNSSAAGNGVDAHNAGGGGGGAGRIRINTRSGARPAGLTATIVPSPSYGRLVAP